MGGLWVMIELHNVESQKDLLSHPGVRSWFQDLVAAYADFFSKERIVWVDVEGIPLNAWSSNTFSRIGNKWGEVMDIEESTGSSFSRKRLCIKTSLPNNILESFKVIFKRKIFMARAKELFTWSPCFSEFKVNDYSSDEEPQVGDNIKPVMQMNVVEEVASDSDEEVVSESLFVAGPTLNCNNNDGDAIQETKMDCISDMDVKFMWGNSNFQYITSDSVGNSGGLLCVWEQSISRSLGFDAMVSQAWNSFDYNDFNKLICFKRKLQDLKKIIRAWINNQISLKKGIKTSLLNKLADIDKVLDSGVKSDEILLSRLEPVSSRFKLNIPFINRLTTDQSVDLDCAITSDEIKAAVWDCGENKSPGPDGFTFELMTQLDGISYWKFLKRLVLVLDGALRFVAFSLLTLSSDSCHAFLLKNPNLLVVSNKEIIWLLCFFILVMESLHLSVSRAVNDDIFKGLQLHDQMTLSHPFYVDDVVKINIQKSSLDGCRSPEEIDFSWRNLLFVFRQKNVLGCWDSILAAKKRGGLGISSFYALNRALLLKWVWRFISQDGSLWYHIIRVLYGTSIDRHGSSFSSCWSSILREVRVLDDKGFNFFSHCKIHVGNGYQTKFWLDSCISDKLCLRRTDFLASFALETVKEISVADKMEASSLVFTFRRPIQMG
ncbi:hypothetical protein Tco_1076975 [Tanacetum coccineum]